MKDALLKIERVVLRSQVFFPLVWLIETTFRRLLWAWGRIRFGTLVQNRGLGCVCHWTVELKYPGNLTLGDRVIIGTHVSIGAHSPIHLDSHVRISTGVQLETASLDFADGTPPYSHVSAPIRVHEGAWIGSQAIILGGVTIGRHAVVAAGAIVTKDVPDHAVVAGMPAKVVKVLQSAKHTETTSP